MPQIIRSRPTRRLAAGALLIMFGAAALVLVPHLGAALEASHAVPPPALDETAIGATSETAIFAGGCFWGVQGVFQHVNGVIGAVSGYTGGEQNTAHYEIVSGGGTGHAESVKVTYDPQQVTYGKLLQIFFSVVHNPTELNRQGPDTGSQYRSAVFPMNEEQAKLAQAYIAQLGQAQVFNGPIVTKVEPGKTFYPAEAYHQDYLTLHPAQPYIAINDLPKVNELKHFFPELYRARPVLVNDGGATHG